MSAIRSKPVRDMHKAESSPYHCKARSSVFDKFRGTGSFGFLNIFSRVKKQHKDEPPSSLNADASTSTLNNERQVLHEIHEIPDDDSDICEVVMIDSTSTPRHEEKQPERLEPQTHVNESNIFSRQAPQAGPSTMPSDPFSAPGSDASPSQARDRVAEFLLSKEKVGTPLNRMEVEGLMSMLHKASEVTEETYKPAPFRFSSSPSPTRLPHTSAQPMPEQQKRTYESANTSRTSSTSRRIFTRVTPSSLPTFKNNISQPSTSPRKVLTRNPNGEYRWTGGGSARVSRSPSPAARQNRYGATSSLGSKLTTSETKRRRVEDESERMDEDKDDNGPTLTSPFTVPSMSVPSNAGQSSSGSSLQPPSVPSRIPRVSLRPRSAAPARPSPLRNVITESPPSSPPSQHQSAVYNTTLPQQRTATHAAIVLSDIIEKVTPQPKPDVSNPYQNASPVKIGLSREKRKVSGGAPLAKASEKVKGKDVKEKSGLDVNNLSEKAKIEATVPKGIKSSRPSAGSNFLNKSTSSSNANRPLPNGTGTKGSYEDDTSIQPATKRQKRRATVEDADTETGTTPATKFGRPSTFGSGATLQPGRPAPARSDLVTVEEVMDEDAIGSSPSYTKPSEIVEPSDDTPVSVFSASTTASLKSQVQPSAQAQSFSASIFGSKSTTLGVKSSAPKEPSKLRETFVAEKEDDSSAAETTSSGKATPPVAPNPFAPRVNGFTFPPKPLVNGVSKPPSSASGPPSTSSVDPKQVAMALDESQLPKYDLSIPPTNLSMDPAHVEARRIVMAMSVDELPVYDLTKPVPNFSNTTASTTSAAEAPTPVAPAPTPAKEVKAFDWAAAGVKPKATANGNTWTCGTCMLQNPASATVKCTVCETPRASLSSQSPTPTPSPAPAKAPEMPAPPVKAFDWAAAGLAPKPKASGDSWTCGTCMLQNPASATVKCTVCDAPKP